MTPRSEPVAQISMRIADRLTDQLAPGGWRPHRFVPDDVVAFVREPVRGVVFHLIANLAGRDGVLLSPSVGVELAAVAELQKHLFGRAGTVCQVSASMADLVNDAEKPTVSFVRWRVSSPDQVDDVVAHLVADQAAHGEPFLVRNQTLPTVIQTLLGQPKSQVEYATLAVCLAVSGDPPGARAMLAKFASVPEVFGGDTTETFIRNFTERFGN
ncbi:hypothetical protein ACPB67_13060 [Micromonospora taraxaci]|uniref:hypothetical protein n=1 Tax=Micromonospora taraxaci TaxID=1316803 RepID=UPI003C2F1106